MSGFAGIGVAIIGTGFISTVHLEALRRLGLRVVGLLGSSAERGAQRAAALGVPKAYESLGELLADPEVDVVHVTSPNHAHYEQVKAVLAAKKHVICEKPLAMTAAQSAEMVKLAKESGLLAAVCYNIRFYPLNQHARGMVKAGELGDIRLLTGHYHQDWLAKPSDWNWRLETDEGGTLRSVADIGTHWLDLVSFIAGMKPTALFAELATFIGERQRPVGPVATFSQGDGGQTETRNIVTDDAGLILLRFANGARGSLTTSQVNMGRKNALSWEIAGASGTAAWDSEHPDHLWLGHRDEANQILQRDAALMNTAGAAAARLPGGHVEGFADTFTAFFHAFYQDVRNGRRAATSNYASFEDGHAEMLLCEAVIESAREGRWVELE